jgi:hypothetical protein
MFVPHFARWPEFRSRLAAFTELLSEAIRFLRTIARSRTALMNRLRGRAVQRASRDSKEVWGVLFCSTIRLVWLTQYFGRWLKDRSLKTPSDSSAEITGFARLFDHHYSFCLCIHASYNSTLDITNSVTWSTSDGPLAVMFSDMNAVPVNLNRRQWYRGQSFSRWQHVSGSGRTRSGRLSNGRSIHGRSTSWTRCDHRRRAAVCCQNRVSCVEECV